MYTELYPVTYYFYPLLEHVFEESPDRDHFFDVLSRPKPSHTENLLYVHIPYCHDLCLFCPFHIRLDHGDPIYHKYTLTLCREMELLAEKPYVRDMVFGAIYFGGGSPSILPVEELEILFNKINQSFQIAADVEISFEGEPRTLGDPERQDILKKYNVSRISFGLQTYDEFLRKEFHIFATLGDVARCARNVRERGFEEINVDMMYDLPGQDLTALEMDLNRLREDDFDSIDYYNLHYYAFPHKFKAAMASGNIPPKPTDTMHLAMAQHIRTRLREFGYAYVADQVFSKKGKLSEYFRLLWGGGDGDHSAETLALGSSARGHLNGYAYMNAGNASVYQDLVEAGKLPIDKLSRRLDHPENRGAVFLPKFHRMNKKYTKAIKTIPSEIWNRWIAEGLIYELPDAWLLSEKGKDWTTNMMVDLFEPHQREVASGSLQIISEKPGVRTGSF
jgi:coproporphyrinogen III oxidase-like Fe-S oxidoreductase